TEFQRGLTGQISGDDRTGLDAMSFEVLDETISFSRIASGENDGEAEPGVLGAPRWFDELQIGRIALQARDHRLGDFTATDVELLELAKLMEAECRLQLGWTEVVP